MPDTSIYIPRFASERRRLVDFVTQRNAKLYQEKQFTMLYDKELDDHLIIAPTPDLGEEQLGVFAGRNYLPGQRVAMYDGDCPWGKQDESIIKEFCEKYQGSGDYMWQVKCDATQSTAIDSRRKGTVARFVNESDDPNVEIVYVNGKAYYYALRPIKFCEEITTSYGKEYYAEKDFIKRKAATLLEVLQGLMPEKKDQINQISDLSSLQQFLLDCNYLFSNDVQNNDVITIEKEIDDFQSNLYFSDGKPLLFLLNRSNETQPDLSLLCKNSKKNEVNITSNYRLAIASLHLEESQTKRFGLFARERIPKNNILCNVSGKFIKRSNVNYKTVNENFFKVDNGYIDTSKSCSESHYIQSGDKDHANVKLCVNGNDAYFKTTKTILPGEIILANFYKMPTPFQYSNLQAMINDFNLTQNKIHFEYLVDNSVVTVNQVNDDLQDVKHENNNNNNNGIVNSNSNTHLPPSKMKTESDSNHPTKKQKLTYSDFFGNTETNEHDICLSINKDENPKKVLGQY